MAGNQFSLSALVNTTMYDRHNMKLIDVTSSLACELSECRSLRTAVNLSSPVSVS